MRYLCIDLGDKRTGLAAGDDVTGLVTPLTVIAVNRGPSLLAALADEVASHAPDAVVMGLPINMDDTEGDRARIARTVGDELAVATGVPVHYQDERLTSFAAEAHLDRSGLTHKAKKQRRDALAAAEILRDFLAG